MQSHSSCVCVCVCSAVNKTFRWNYKKNLSRLFVSHCAHKASEKKGDKRKSAPSNTLISKTIRDRLEKAKTAKAKTKP